MNKRGVVSFKSIQNSLPLKNLLFLCIFGSQVRGTENSKSDLDILYVTNKRGGLMDILYDAALCKGGVENVTILPHTISSIKERANLYGTVEYDILYNINMKIKILVKYPNIFTNKRKEIDYIWCSKDYLKQVKEDLDICFKENYSNREISAWWALNNLLRACLLYERKKFPY